MIGLMKVVNTMVLLGSVFDFKWLLLKGRKACLDFTTRAVTAGKMRQREQHLVSEAHGTAAVFEEAS